MPVPVPARQTGPRTFENLLDPPAEAKPDEARTPFDDPRPTDGRKPAAGNPTPPPTTTKRLPVPEQVAVDEALELINQAYDEQIKAAAASPETAIRTFRDTADKTADPARKYALLLLAERLALEADATSQALEVVARRAALFEIDPLVARHGLLSRIARAEGFRPDALFFEHVVETAGRAVDADRFDLADAAADLAVSTAKAVEKDEKMRTAESRRKREPPPTPVAARLLAEGAQLQKSVRERRRLAFEYTAACDKLVAYPDDPEAAEVVGRYLCFVKHDWKAGLPALARGRHDGLRSLSAREIALAKKPDAPALDRFALANEWWKLADAGDAFPTAQAELLRAHAGAIYAAVAPQLTDPIDVALARKRAKSGSVAEQPAATAPGPAARSEPALPTLDSLLQGQGG